MSGLHDGHRKRLREKFKNGRETFNEHELLELLLGYSIARKDTNALAHQLISEFGSLNGVLSASPEALVSVKGVGETTANMLSRVGYVSLLKKKEKSSIVMDTLSSSKKVALDVFDGIDHEVLFVFYLDGQKRIISSSRFDDGDVSNVSIDFDAITNSLILYKPKSVIIMHNHFSKYPLPSENDDKATAKLYTFLSFHKVSLLDHVIVSGKEIYSYFYDGRLDKIKNTVDVKFN